ncbi:hypothetical protein LMB68_00695 [Limosilactobacillus reuteri]|uniref:hypothetical protein n=1 Tax=Limosilactobacillus reuteri TaxID=1598 RepID=UPI001CDC9C00|nr:hypothetical protein [Limosilactobacillus reuteri]MCC4412879.1 hypothetical protein [Limosilactobacillus reuteri]
MSFKAGLKRVITCVRNYGIKANMQKKHKRIKRHEEHVNDSLLNKQFNRQSKNGV